MSLRTEQIVFFEGHRHEVIRTLSLLEDILGMPRSVAGTGHSPMPAAVFSPDERKLGEQQRRVLISSLCLADDILGRTRTVPPKEERRNQD